jgi:hypothetical protein
MNDMVSSRKTGGLAWSGTIWSLSGYRVYQRRVSDEHAIAVAEEAVLLLDGMAVGGEHLFAAGEGADQHQQARFGQVEVGEQRADQAKLEAGRDEDLRSPECGSSSPPAGSLKCAVLKRAHHGGADGDDAAAFATARLTASAAAAESV